MDLIEKGVHYANSKGDIPVFYPEASTPGIADAELVETEQQSRLTTIYEQLEEKVKNLEKTEVEVVTLSRKVDNLQEELKGNENKIKLLNVEVKTLRKVLKPNANNPVVSEILEKAMDNFKSVLDEVEKTNYDKTLIVKLLDTNTELVSVGGAHSLAIKERGYNHEIARLNAMITPLQYKLARYQYATAGGPPEFDPATDKAFLNVLQTMIFSAIPGQFYASLLSDIGRADLKEKFVQQHPEHKQKKNVPYPDQAAAGQTPTASQQPTEFKQMKQQIADMHTWMESARQGFRGESESWSVPAFDIPQSFKGNDRTGATEETKPRTQSEKDKA
ncbi:hypothetical protein MAR_018905 [Mya arenaria]|uniref:Uncharacterized protein n=1 Tax=Mya arenaria TaxID=6604 RepID=A0ABY7EG11_MYAAR|nr:hypothetical protein MAR_018905 [Mya arenaria]